MSGLLNIYRIRKTRVRFTAYKNDFFFEYFFRNELHTEMRIGIKDNVCPPVNQRLFSGVRRRVTDGMHDLALWDAVQD